MIGLLIDDHQRVGQLLTSYMRFSDLSAACKGLYRERFGEDDRFEDLRDLMIKAENIGKERNRITHSIWGAGELPDSVTRINRKRGLQFEFKQFDEKGLAEFGNEIKEVACDIQLFQVRMIGAIRESQNNEAETPVQSQV